FRVFRVRVRDGERTPVEDRSAQERCRTTSERETLEQDVDAGGYVQDLVLVAPGDCDRGEKVEEWTAALELIVVAAIDGQVPRDGGHGARESDRRERLGTGTRYVEDDRVAAVRVDDAETDRLAKRNGRSVDDRPRALVRLGGDREGERPGLDGADV